MFVVFLSKEDVYVCVLTSTCYERGSPCVCICLYSCVPVCVPLICDTDFCFLSFCVPFKKQKFIMAKA